VVRLLVTGSSGHLGEALVRTLATRGHEVTGLDVLPSATTDWVGSISDARAVTEAMRGVEAVLHTATLHKPHVGTHSRQAFVDTNVTGTLNLLEAAVAAGARAFVYTSTTSVFGDAMAPPPGAPAAWIDGQAEPIAKNIYGATKRAAEDLCRLFHRNHGLPCVVLRTSRFFPEADDDDHVRDGYEDANVKTNEFLYRRVDLEDVVGSHEAALERAGKIRFGTFVVSATTPFRHADVAELRNDAPAVLALRVPEYAGVYAARGWRMFPSIDRVYDNRQARELLGWQPRHDFRAVLERVQGEGHPLSALARRVGAKGYHPDREDGYPFAT
jgi:nucleoside-diphosphate-sugar epimerase